MGVGDAIHALGVAWHSLCTLADGGRERRFRPTSALRLIPLGESVTLRGANMRMRQAATGLAALVISASACLGRGPQPGTLRTQWELSNNTIHVRGQVFNEGELGHRLAIFDERRCHFALSQALPGPPVWRLIGNAYFSPCDADLKSQFRFVNDQVAYFFMQWRYMVTVNGAKTWQFWDVSEHLRGRAFDGQRLIQDVSMKPDGHGTMRLNPESMAGGERLVLQTGDFGQHWRTP
jgi:hypothetical protein